jgi:hypothetical protein
MAQGLYYSVDYASTNVCSALIEYVQLDLNLEEYTGGPLREHEREATHVVISCSHLQVLME